MRRLLAALLVGALALTACGDDDDETTTTGDTSSTTVPDGTTTTEPSSTTLDPDTSTTLPGEPIEIFPYDGATLAVVGVAADDVLNVRDGPGADFAVVATLEPLATGMTATGNNRSVPGAIWVELTTDDGETGWVNGSFVLQPGMVTDETAALFPTVADRPTAETMTDLAAAVAAEVASDEPESDVVIVDGPDVGDLGEVTVDVIGLGDDSVGGLRLVIFAEPGDESFTVRSVEQTILCMRGVTDDGLCI